MTTPAMSDNTLGEAARPGVTTELAMFCSRCGVAPEDGDHTACQRWLAAEEPPRFCTQCGRRMKVQIVPTGWSAECSRHGRSAGGTWS